MDLAGHVVWQWRAEPLVHGSPGPPTGFAEFVAALRPANASCELVRWGIGIAGPRFTVLALTTTTVAMTLRWRIFAQSQSHRMMKKKSYGKRKPWRVRAMSPRRWRGMIVTGRRTMPCYPAWQVGSEPICSLGVKQLGHHCKDLTPSCPLPPGRWGIRSSPPSLTCIRAIAQRVRRVAWQESPSYGQPWAGSLLVGPLEKPSPTMLGQGSLQLHQVTTSGWARPVASPVTYVVADAADEPIKGTFYGSELQKFMPPDYFDVESILDTHRRGNTTEHLVKWAGYPASFNSWDSDVVRNSGSPVTRQRRAGQRRGAASSSEGLKMANPTLALDSSMVFTLPSNASQALYPENTVTDFRVALPKVWRCAAMTSKPPWLASLMPAHGTMCQTWQVRRTWPVSTSCLAISILRHVAMIAQSQPLQRLRALRKRHHLMLVRARCSSRAGGPLALDTTNTSGKSFMTWMGMAAAAGWRSSSAITPSRTVSWWPSGLTWMTAWAGWRCRGHCPCF